MEQVRVEPLDHLGVLASVIKDIGLIDMINSRLVPDEPERITPGEAVAGMILHGLGFAHRPLSLTPQFFANTPLDRLFREGINAEMVNRFKLGRTLDEAHAYGCDLLWQERALSVCIQEGIDLRFNHLDTTSVALTGQYVPDSDEHAMTITHGDSKDHRPDLRQAVLALMGSEDGGVPLVSKSWNGNTSDTQVFQQRAEALMSAFKDTPTPRSLVADAKLYCEDNTIHLAKLGCITRIQRPSSWCRRSLAKHSRGIPGSHWMTTPAISLWRCATMAWPSVGWSCIHERLLNEPTPRSTPPNSANTKPSQSRSFPCKPNVLAHLKALKRPSQRWPNAGRIPASRPIS